ncbi:hypothetical protein KJ742_03610 [Patescibacteria group bacterium]|nr:hypothetical protein [Patescibacteria group bacterium]MBU1683008.1 hypothetical protein [Patescibacteria group bacterium]MBU1934647.1 hypothetical protein [Patescibacteria group bacterium]
MFKHRFRCDWDAGKIWKVLFIVWIIFATLYVLYGEYNRLRVYVAGVSYNRGVTAAVNKMMDEASSCQPVPITSGDRGMNIINLDCFTVPEGEASE